MEAMVKARLVIEAPEGVSFSLPLAGPGSRLLALTLDMMIVAVAANVMSKGLSLFSVFSRDLGDALGLVAYFVISTGYGIAMEWAWRGQTVGKRLLSLHVVDANGGRLQVSQIVMRNLVRAVDILPAFYLLGGVVSLCSAKFQRLGDIAAGTVVVRKQELRVPDLENLLGGRFNSMLGYRHLAARLRQRTPPELAALSLEAMLRREDLDPEPRLRLFAELATRFRELVAFPAEAVETLSDEQYVRNAVEIVFRPRTALLQ
jgi:uncharacterized RDD family membrane protein YckC